MDKDAWIPTAKTALERAVAAAGSQNKLALAIKQKLPTFGQGRLWQWLQRGYAGVDDGACLIIEGLTGVPKEELRPDVYRPSGDIDPNQNHRNPT